MGWHHKLTQTFSLLGTIGIVAISAGAITMLAQGSKFLSVQSGSMAPAFRKGDLVIDTPLNSRIPLSQQLAVGDVVTYSNPALLKGAPVTHRLVQTANFANGNYFITKGDANHAADPPITARNIIGRVEHRIPYAGYAVDFVRKPLGLILLIYLPALAIVITELRRLAKYYAYQEPYRAWTMFGRQDHTQTRGSSDSMPAISSGSSRARLMTRSTQMVKTSALAMLIAVIVAVPSVQAALHSSASLSASSIAIAPRQTSPGHLLIYQVQFGAPVTGTSTSSSSTTVNVTTNTSQTATSGNASSTAGGATSGSVSNSSSTSVTINTGSSSSEPTGTQTVILYNPTAAAIDLAGYTLSDNDGIHGIINGSIASNSIYSFTWPVAGGLRRSGDHLILKNTTVASAIDALSWGSDTTQLNPSVHSADTTLRLIRTSPGVDTDTASDWSN